MKRVLGLTLSLCTVVGLLLGTTGCPEGKKTTTDKKVTTETKTPGGTEKKTEEKKTTEQKKP